MSYLFGRIKDGKIQLQRFYEKELIKNEGKPVEVKIGKESKTTQQLRYLWGVVYQLVSEHTGFTPGEVSEVYKRKFLAYDREYQGRVFSLSKGLSELDKDEMKKFIDEVINHAQGDLGIIIPEPDIEYKSNE